MIGSMNIADNKARLRNSALERRRFAASRSATKRANERLIGFLNQVGQGKAVAGYLPIRSEIDPTNTMGYLTKINSIVCVPVVCGPGLPLKFRQWMPGIPLIQNAFGTSIPESGDFVEPELLIVPVVAFDSACTRLGYGGGFYDRTLQILRAKRTQTDQPLVAVGFAYSDQEHPAIPRDVHDQRLDAIVTEAGLTVAEP